MSLIKHIQNHIENQRVAEEAARNERRFDAYNVRREAAGLPPLKWADYIARKHRLHQTVAECKRHIAAPKPTHRDNIVFLTR